jgi:hypothetical protein
LAIQIGAAGTKSTTLFFVSVANIVTKRMIDENQSQDCCFYGGVGTTT